MAKLLSIFVSVPKTEGDEHTDDSMRAQWTSAFAKDPVFGPVQLNRTNLAGDGQADLKHHGGPDKAVLCYGVHHYADWAREYPGIPLGHGAFGENFVIDELSESTVCIGDIYAIGEVRVQVSQPRIPCWKVSRRWQTPGLTERVSDTGRTGWYLRVLDTGVVQAGMAFELLSRPYPTLTISAANDLLNHRNDDISLLCALDACPDLAAPWKSITQNFLRKYRDNAERASTVVDA